MKLGKCKVCKYVKKKYSRNGFGGSIKFYYCIHPDHKGLCNFMIHKCTETGRIQYCYKCDKEAIKTVKIGGIPFNVCKEHLEELSK